MTDGGTTGGPTSTDPTNAVQVAAIRDTARRFVQAILWSEHLTVWELLSPGGREHVLAAGERRGLDPLQAQRLRLGTSPMEERDAFLTGLIHGLRVDFSGVALEEAEPVEPFQVGDDGAVEVRLECPATFAAEGWSAGSLVVSPVDDGWKVDRVIPLVSGGG